MFTSHADFASSHFVDEFSMFSQAKCTLGSRRSIDEFEVQMVFIMRNKLEFIESYVATFEPMPKLKLYTYKQK